MVPKQIRIRMYGLDNNGEKFDNYVVVPGQHMINTSIEQVLDEAVEKMQFKHVLRVELTLVDGRFSISGRQRYGSSLKPKMKRWLKNRLNRQPPAASPPASAPAASAPASAPASA